MVQLKSQSVQTAVIQISAALVGGLSTMFIYPYDLQLYGLYGFLSNTASLFAPFISLGFGNVLLRYFPFYDNANEHHKGFFGFIVLAYVIGLSLFTTIFIAFYPYFRDHYFSLDPLIKEYFFYLLPITILIVLYELSSQFCINYQRINLPAKTAFFLKVYLPIIFILAAKNHLDKQTFLLLIFAYYLCSICWLLVKLKTTTSFSIRFKTDLLKDPAKANMFRYAAYSILGGASAVIALRLDSVLISSLIGAEANGLFTLAMFMCNVVFIPATAITDSVNALVSRLTKEQDQLQMDQLYKKTSRTMLIPTLWLSLCIVLSFSHLAAIMPNSERIISLELTMAFLLLARLMDAITGVNHHILSYSKYYKMELYLLLLMAVLNIGFNYLLIPEYGIAGAAMATFLSVGIYNVLKTLVVYYLLKMHPFTSSLLKIVLLAISVFILINMIPFGFTSLLNIMAISLTTSIIFLGTIYLLNWSVELNEIAHLYAGKIKSKLR